MFTTLTLEVNISPQTVTTTGHNKSNKDLSSKRLQRDAAVPATSLNRSHLALGHMTFKHTGKFQARDRGA